MGEQHRAGAVGGGEILLAHITHTDSRPIGLIARYKGERGNIKVVFLILDLGQHIQTNAAKTADSTNPRNKKAGSTS
jgi:hypothetical protein